MLEDQQTFIRNRKQYCKTESFLPTGRIGGISRSLLHDKDTVWGENALRKLRRSDHFVQNKLTRITNESNPRNYKKSLCICKWSIGRSMRPNLRKVRVSRAHPLGMERENLRLGITMISGESPSGHKYLLLPIEFRVFEKIPYSLYRELEWPWNGWCISR